MDVRVLGSLEIVDDGAPLPLGGPKARTVLALLLLSADRVVTVDRLIDALWGSAPPETARNTLQTYVRHLRRAIGADRIEHRSGGYVFRAESSELDLDRFESLVARARGLAPSDPVAAAAAFREALALWRGPALDDLADQTALAPEIARLEELRLAAVEERIDAELETGRHHQLVPELETLVRLHPYRERCWRQLMIALYRSARQADALAAFRRAREVLLDELGVDPSPELRSLEARILAQDPTLDPAGEPLRGYRVLGRIGEGASGVVSRALQPHVGREVAIKQIHRSLANDPAFVRRFEREARIVARIEHPHVVPLYDYWRDDEGAFLVMRYVRGGNLRARIDPSAPIATEDAARILGQVADALGAAHRQGVIHRDVKPENILLDEDGNAYLSDFGIATDLIEPESERARTSRSSTYASPEQLRGEPVTRATDVYSLGVVVHELLAGRTPLPPATPGSAGRDPAAPLPSIRETRPDLPGAVDEVIATATEPDPARRSGDVRAFASAVVEALGAEPREASEVPTNPYKGLQAFDEPDALDFFGRERAVARLLDRLDEGSPDARFLAVVGPSGSGKSSVVRAGLLPALRQGALTGSERWFITDLVPGEQPFDGLARALERIATRSTEGLSDRLRADASALAEEVAALLPDDPAVELLLLVDQLEEVFTITGSESERTTFLAALTHAVTAAGTRIRLVVTLRADFYDAPLLDARFGPLLAARTEAIAPLSPQELERAIVGPSERAGVSMEPSLLAAIVADVADQPAALPLLQYSLTELFELRRGGAMSLDAYRAIGGAGGAVAKRAEELYEAFDRDEREACHQLFLRLIALDETGEATRRRVSRSELASLEVDTAALERVITGLGEHRLLSFDRDASTREPTAEVAHEALLDAWRRLRGWLDDGREDVMLHRRLAASADEWEASGCEPGFLLTGGRLERIGAWVRERHVALTARERRFVNESLERHGSAIAAERARAAHEREVERRSIRRLRALVAALSAAALLAATLTVLAIERGASAERRRDEALVAALTGEALSSLDRDPALSVMLALHAIDLSRSVRQVVPSATREALHWAMQEADIEYPVTDGPVAVIDGPLGSRGVYDLPISILADRARRDVSRPLTEAECGRFFGSEGCPTLPTTFPPGLEGEPLQPADANGGPPLAGTNVTMWWGAHQDADALELFRRELDRFTERTGVVVSFVDDPEVESWISSAEVESDAPDVASLAPSVAADLGRAGLAIDLRAFLDMGELRARQSPYLVRLGTVGQDGEWPVAEGSLYGVFTELNVKSLVWYPKPELRRAGFAVPSTLSALGSLTDRLARTGRTPWCLAFESGGATGWPGTDWIENLVLAQAGVDVYDAWTSHRLDFDSAPIRAAFHGLDDIVLRPGAVLGGTSGILETSIFDAPHALVEDPPRCWLHLQASFAAGFLPPGAAGTRTDVFPFPRGDEGAAGLLGGGEMTTAFSDRPEVRALVRFLLSPEHGVGFAQRGTGFMSPNRAFDLRTHTPFLRPVARTLRDALEADTFRFDGSDLMPPEIGAELFWTSMVRYVEEGPRVLDEILVQLDEAWPDG